MNSFKNKILYCIWRCVMYLLIVHSAILDVINAVKQNLVSKFNLDSNVFNFLHCVQNLPKLPKHVAVIFQNETLETGFDENNNFLDLEKVSEKLAYLIGAGVSTITLYDVDGILKSLHSTVKAKFEEKYKLFQSSASFEKNNRFISDIIWHKSKCARKCIKMNFGVPTQALTSRDPAHIFITSYADGKSKFLEMIKNGAKMEIRKKRVRISPDPDSILGHSLEPKNENKNSSYPDENFIKQYLKPDCCQCTGWTLEPDLLISYGRRQTTSGFLPWHLRLTDLHWIKRQETNDVLSVLQKFAECKHRYGK